MYGNYDYNIATGKYTQGDKRTDCACVLKQGSEKLSFTSDDDSVKYASYCHYFNGNPAQVIGLFSQ